MRAFFLALVGCVACGSSSDTDAGADAMPEAAAMEAAADSGTAPKYSGAVIVTTNAAQMTYSVFGLFQPIATPPSCNQTNTSPCSFSDCPNPAANDAGAGSYFVAGTLDVTVGAANTIPVPKMANGEYRVMGAMTLFKGGDMLQAKWTGDPMGAPAASLSAVGASHITVTNPSFPVVGLPIARSMPFNLSWTGGMFGKVRVSLWTTPMNRVNTISCVVDATAGSLSVASSLLSMPAGSSAFLSIDAIGGTEATQGDWSFSLEAHDTPTDPNGRALLLVGAVLN